MTDIEVLALFLLIALRVALFFIVSFMMRTLNFTEKFLGNAIECDFPASQLTEGSL